MVISTRPPSSDDKYILLVSGHVPYMQTETAGASECLYGHLSDVHDVTAGGAGMITRSPAALDWWQLQR